MTSRSYPKDWDLAELSNREIDGKTVLSLHRNVAGGPWLKPHWIELDGDRLVWRFDDQRISTKHGPDVAVTPAREIIDGFVNLKEASDEEILGFARKWGPLNIGKDGLPRERSHVWAAGTVEVDYWHTAEPLAAWRHYSGRLWTLLDVVARLDKCRRLPLEQWYIFPGYPARNDPFPWLDAWAEERPRHWEDLPELWLGPWTKRTHELAVWAQVVAWPQDFGPHAPTIKAWLIEAAVDVWLLLGGVRPSFTWRAAEPSVELGGYGLFGAIATQVMMVVGKIDGFAVCRGCGRMYSPRRQPRPGENTYCTDCGRTAANRINQRKRRVKIKE